VPRGFLLNANHIREDVETIFSFNTYLSRNPLITSDDILSGATREQPLFETGCSFWYCEGDDDIIFHPIIGD
jgi:hypothetical protein